MERRKLRELLRSALAVLLFALAAMRCPAGETAKSEESKGSPSATLDDGKALVEANCLQCHRSDKSTYPDHTYGWIFRRRYDRGGWTGNVDRMEKIAIRDEYIGKGDWSKADKESMVSYLVDQTRIEPTTLGRVGYLHFSVVHFPIALIFVAGFFELAGILAGWPIRRNMLHCLWYLAVLSAALAVTFGYCLIWDVPELSEDLWDHRAAGLATLVSLFLGLALREIAASTNAGWARWGFRAALVLAAASAGAAGHLGGRIVHGEYMQPLFGVLQSWTK